MAMRVYVDFNTMMMDPEERVYIGKEGSLQDDQDVLAALHPDLPVVLFDEEMQVEAIPELDPETGVWLGRPIWSTQRDLLSAEQGAVTSW